MASVTNSPGTIVDDDSAGSVAWSDPGNAASSNDSYAVAAGSFTTSHYLKATNFEFSIPVNSTINGIVVENEVHCGSTTNGATENAARIVKGGSIGSTDKSTTEDWLTTDSYISHGGSSDLWGETWTYSDINSSTFGFAMRSSLGVGSAYVDHIRITVYYTEATTTSSTSSSSSSTSSTTSSSSSSTSSSTSTTTTFPPTIPWSDNFNDNSLDLNKWIESTNAGSLVAEQNNRIELISNASVSGFIRSLDSYVLQNTQVIIQVLQHCTDGGLKICPTVVASHEWDVYSENDWYNFQLIASGVLSPNVKDAGVAAQVGEDSPGLTPPYWMRMRISDTTIYFDYAEQVAKPTEGEWTNISSETWDMGTGITQEQYIYLTGYNTPTTGELYYDNFSWETYSATTTSTTSTSTSSTSTSSTSSSSSTSSTTSSSSSSSSTSLTTSSSSSSSTSTTSTSLSTSTSSSSSTIMYKPQVFDIVDENKVFGGEASYI